MLIAGRLIIKGFLKGCRLENNKVGSPQGRMPGRVPFGYFDRKLGQNCANKI